MKALATPTLGRLTTTVRGAIVALTISLVAVTGAASPATADTPSTYDDCAAGRHRTGTSALALRLDPAPNCAGVLNQQVAAAPDRRRPGIQP